MSTRHSRAERGDRQDAPGEKTRRRQGGSTQVGRRLPSAALLEVPVRPRDANADVAKPTGRKSLGRAEDCPVASVIFL